MRSTMYMRHCQSQKVKGQGHKAMPRSTTKHRNRSTRWWGQFLDRKQNWRHFCACALKMKSPKHSENVFRQKSYSPVTGNLRRRSEWRDQIFDRKLVSRRFCACAVKNRPKTRLFCCQIAKILALFGQSQSLNTTVFKPDKNLILSADCNKTANINVKIVNSLKQCLTATRPTSHN